MRHVKHSAGIADSIMLLYNTFILNGHVKASERGHLRTHGNMTTVQTGFLDFFHDIIL